ncbi:hypothetical protein ALC60_03738 [Trachymyrmex zeteki]|uniref:Uncharacterized protein n=1 Tax=Mycetomoellerius zeteki TaxID=64791 RepID=A0A151XAA4_9HYME|nr:hypothetical protein ALC60_03738 [Trachymyrmex zeteki]
MGAELYVKMRAPKLIRRTIKFRSVGAAENVTLGLTHAKVCIDDEHFEVDFHVIPDVLLNDDLILGSDFLNEVDMRIRDGKIINITKIVEEINELTFVNKIDVISKLDEVDLSHISDSQGTASTYCIGL